MNKKILVFLNRVLTNLSLARRDGDKVQISLCLGSIRGFVHALGTFDLIPKSCEYQVCSMAFDEMSLQTAKKAIKHSLEKGFEDKKIGFFNATDYVCLLLEGGDNE